MIKKSIDSVPLLFFKNLSKNREIKHFVSTRIGGFSNQPYHSLNLGFHTGDNPAAVLKNRKQLALMLGVPLHNFVTAKQVHGSQIRIITRGSRGQGAFDYDTATPLTDAMVTDVTNIVLMVLQADCVPVLLFDARRKVIGIIHAGWKGTVKKISKDTILVLKEKFGCLPADILAGIGPSIGPCCYEIGPEIIAEISNVFYLKSKCRNQNTASGKNFFDLWKANKMQLMEAGVPEENIETAGICTYCNHHLFFSHRNCTTGTGRFGAGIMLRD
ncbi:MAG: peptidoglycan editing factor PgeF [Candidatus Loosdrechtia sp.]|uniref:polyphenol oxidase family protein n=1 Tax=Candidatus Loosdrechtia sp. TaxID=3101272 RepID=UPI003A799B25|nr:MAG: peptidoglycan editing factor PgeF [Candidatus Jettenia sp. AMX2]